MTASEWVARFDAAVVAAPARRRVLREELVAHFADACEAGETEAAAVRAAGSPERVAAECSRVESLCAVERGLWFLAGGVAVLGLLWLTAWFLYPWGNWQSPPLVLYAPHHIGLGAWAAAGATGIAALLALRWRRLSRHHTALGLAASALMVLAMALHLGAGTVYIWLRNDIVAGSPSDTAQTLISAVHVALGGVAVFPLVRAARRLAGSRRRS